MAKHGIKPSMNGTAKPQDNAVAESFFSALKNELVHHETFYTRDEAKQMITEYIDRFFNRRRIHQSLGYRTPEQVEQEYRGANLNRPLKAG
ncbi:MAG: transposase, partial [Rhodocyclaceae bacterium]|nr:transposase [Rhodocyclaceae bacterium]